MAHIFLVFGLLSAASRSSRHRRQAASDVEDREFEALNVSGAFFRGESRLSRDLAVLAAEVACNEVDAPLIVDAFAGAGSRALRYARDVSNTRKRIIANEPNPETELGSNVGDRNIEIRHQDASRFLRELAVDREAAVVDVDSFGISFDVADAVNAVRDDGIVLLATTGAAAAGTRGVGARRSLRARLGCTAADCGEAQNEFGLRALLGRAAAVANAAGDALSVVCSLYSTHGPVFRVIATVRRKNNDREKRYLFHRARDAFLEYHRYFHVCSSCGHVTPVDGDDLGTIVCADCGSRDGDIAGPLWTGPLYDGDALRQMQSDALERGWLRDTPAGRQLRSTLDLMLDEVHDPRLFPVPLYTSIDAVARRAKLPTPRIDDLSTALRRRGFAVAKTHIDPKGLRTDAPMSACISAARDLSGGVM